MPSISLCMIVKDEEKYLPECLASVKGLVDEMIVVDTGSKDGTKAIAKDAGATVLDFPWTGDFSAARNAALKHVTKDWVLMLDADEVVSAEDAGKIRALLAHADEFIDKKVMGFLLDVRNHCAEKRAVPEFGVFETDTRRPTSKGAGFFAMPLVRLFKNGRGFLFDGAIHETINASIMSRRYGIARTDIVIDHYGFLKGMGVIDAKAKIYAAALVAQLAKDPDDARSNYYMGRFYKTQGKLDMALHHFLRVISADPNIVSFSVDPYLDIGDIYLAQNHHHLARSYYEKSFANNPYQKELASRKIGMCEDIINEAAAGGGKI